MRQTHASIDAVARLTADLGPGPWRLRDVRATGWTDAAVRAAMAAGRVVRPRRGVVALPGASDTDPRHDIRAALLVAGPYAVVSHDSAVRWHELWQPRLMSPLVHLTVPGEPGRVDRGVRIHRSALPAELVTTTHGWPVTTLARTAADAARGRPLIDAAALVDSAARRILEVDHGFSPRGLRETEHREHRRDLVVAALNEAAESVAGWPGSRVLQRAIALVEPLSESAFETWSRVWIHASALPRPEVAFAVQGASGRWYYSDFGWPEHGVLGEADGIGKYGTDPAHVARALRAERLRQRDLEDADWTVMRWDSAEPPRSVLRRLRTALVGEDRRRWPK
jgi:hypothetical protein